MTPEDQRNLHSNPLMQKHPQDTLLHAAAVISCLQHLDLESGLEDEAELGLNLILETVRYALRFEALDRHSSDEQKV